MAPVHGPLVGSCTIGPMDKPTILILAGGENSRFFPLNTTTHKGALTLLGKPLVIRTLENLEKHGFPHVVMIVSKKDFDGNGLSGFIKEFDFKLKIDFVLQPDAQGMGNAVLCAKDKIKGSFGVVFPSSLDAGELMETLMKQAGNGGSLAVRYTQEPWLYGIVTLDGQHITSIVEKPTKGTEPSNLMATGVYYLSHEFLEFLQVAPQTQYNFEESLDKFVQVYTVTAVEQSHTLPSLKYPWHLFAFQQVLFADLPNYISPYATVAKTAVIDAKNGPVYIENGATIGHAVKIVGPAYIGKDVFIGDFSLIRHSSFEQGSSVGVHSDVTRSIIMEDSSMHNGFLGDSIVGRDVQIGAGLITSNKRMDRAPIEVVVKGNKVASRLTGLGTVIGDHAKVGVRVTIMPGKFVGCRAIVYPGITVWEHVPHDHRVKSPQTIELVER